MDTVHDGSQISSECRGKALSQEKVDAFRQATMTRNVQGIPPTIVTLFRDAEYKLFEMMKVNWDGLIHGDQEYEYLKPIPLDVEPRIETRVVEQKQRTRGDLTMKFVKLESRISFDGELTVVSRGTFVVRETVGEKP